ncbi:X-Pro dipeptidyl-peptidase-domain-containing protein [Xylariales sp. PMI_506]|nr:X-Pro dipeptidyl-peptidase-domain-containing protein [Xylariales sp. PMI_506]
MASESQPRSYGAWLADRLVGWFVSAPSEECFYTKQSGLRIPMRDGIHILADLYEPAGLPEGSNPHGLIYILGCYGREGVMSILMRLFAPRGYIVLFVSCRGTFGSEGTFAAGMSERDDSQDIVKWMRAQPWYPGSFATFGPSYLGYSQWALLEDPPEDLIASAILCGPHDQAVHNWGPNGAFRLDRVQWAHLMAELEKPGSKRMRALHDETALGKLYSGIPLYETIKKHFEGGASSWFPKNLTVDNPEDAHWQPARHGTVLDKTSTPVLLVSGWYDPFTYQSLEQFRRLRKHNDKVYLTVGPWTHTDASGLHSMPEVFNFFDEHVAKRRENHRPVPVKMYVTGAEEWREMPDWPPAETKPRMFFLHSDHSLAAEPPHTDEEDNSFIFDPSDPPPTIGGNHNAKMGGRKDDSVYASRPDMLVYTSEPLKEDVEFLGPPTVELLHSTEVPYADLFVRLSEVDVKGVSHNVVETYQALAPDRKPGETLQLSIQDGAHRFKKGTRIRLIIAGGSFPFMARNPGYAGNRTMATELRSVKHTLKLAGGVSKIVLPCSV